MKTPLELNFSNNIMQLLETGKQQGVDVINVLESILVKMKKAENHTEEPIDPYEYIGQKILFTSSFDYGLKQGKIVEITPKGYLKIEEYKDTGNGNITMTNYFDPQTVYIQDTI